jgi:16S rRNA (guanine966-N2)-methyltransferase
VFLDPPYEVPTTELAGVLAAVAAAGAVVAGATVVLERPKGSEAVLLPDGWGIEKARGYGDTLLVVARAGSPAPR